MEHVTSFASSQCTCSGREYIKECSCQMTDNNRQLYYQHLFNDCGSGLSANGILDCPPEEQYMYKDRSK